MVEMMTSHCDKCSAGWVQGGGCSMFVLRIALGPMSQSTPNVCHITSYSVPLAAQNPNWGLSWGLGQTQTQSQTPRHSNPFPTRSNGSTHVLMSLTGTYSSVEMSLRLGWTVDTFESDTFKNAIAVAVQDCGPGNLQINRIYAASVQTDFQFVNIPDIAEQLVEALTEVGKHKRAPVLCLRVYRFLWRS